MLWVGGDDVATSSLELNRWSAAMPQPNDLSRSLVAACGRICMHRKGLNISTVLAGQRLGIKEVDDGIWIAASCITISASSISNRKPCNPSTTPSAQGCHPCLRYVSLPMSPVRTLEWLVAGEGFEPPTLGL